MKLKANMSMQWEPDELRAVDAAAARLGIGRSEYIRRACREKMARDAEGRPETRRE